MALDDWEFQYKNYVFGGDNAISVVEVTGLLDAPDIVVVNHALMRRNGLLPGKAFARGRTVRFVVDIVAATEPEFTTLVSEIREMVNPLVDESEMLLKIPSAFGGGEARIVGRVIRSSLPVDLPFLYRNTQITFDFFCSYPFVQSSTLINTSMTLATVEGGRTYDRTYDLTYSTASEGGSYLITNTGTTPADYTAVFTGPLVKPRLTLTETGEYLEFDITLLDGQTLVVDTATRTALLGGTASRINTLTPGSTWWQLPADPVGKFVAFTAASYSLGSAVLSHRSTYI